MMAVDEQLERVVPGMLEAHAVHLEDQRYWRSLEVAGQPGRGAAGMYAGDRVRS